MENPRPGYIGTGAGRGSARPDLAQRYVPPILPEEEALSVDYGRVAKECSPHGVIIRPAADGWARVTVGTEAENEAFFAALDSVTRP